LVGWLVGWLVFRGLKYRCR